MPAKFFVRLYSKTEQEVLQFIKEYRELMPACVEAKCAPLAMSVNLAPPPSSWEVDLVFSSAAARTAAYHSEEGRALYMKYANPKGVQGKFVARQPGDKAFQHNGGAK